MIKLFKKKVFTLESEEAYIKYKMNGLNDPTLPDFKLLSTAPITKEKFKKEDITKEYILSYINSAKLLADACNVDNNNSVKLIMLTYSFSIPCLFLCRQAIELKIKDCLEKRQINYIPIHSIVSLWNTLETSLINEEVTDEDKIIISEMNRFINLLSKLDNENATKLRYPKDKSGNISQERVVFVCLKKIVDTAYLLIKQLDNIK